MRSLLAAIVIIGTSQPALAQRLDVTVFGGGAFPLYDERLTLRPGALSITGIEVTSTGTPELKADGGPVLGAAVACEFGLLAIEGRLDATDVGLEFTGIRYDLRGTAFPFTGLTASLVASEGRFDADRIPLLSLNARVRTPGPVSFIASGGLSYLPEIDVSGSIPLTVNAPDIGPVEDFTAGVTLRATPGQARHRFGVNGGAGVRVGGRVALVADVRAFYFREYELRFARDGGPEILDRLFEGADVVRFEPVFVNAQAGISFRF